jgi:PIN domain
VDEWGLPGGGQVISLCVDLNVWVRYLLGSRRGNTRQTAADTIVEAARSGRSAAGPVQLVVSHTMLSRLEDVLIRLAFPSGDASAFCSLIGAFARRGPYGVAPHLVPGGGTSPTAESSMPIYNPYDPSIVPPRGDDEDGRVLDTAVAGRAHILATYNFGDFTSPNTVILEPGHVQVFQAAPVSVLIMHADRVADYLRTGHLSATSLRQIP